MTTNASESQGYKLEVQTTDSTPSWLEVKECKNFNVAPAQSAEIDVTHLQSTSKEYLIGLRDNGEFTADCNWVSNDPGQAEVLAAWSDREERSFRATYPRGDVATFTGFVRSFAHQGAVEAAITGSISIRISGEYDIAVAT